MSDLDPDETRALAKTLARQLGPHLSGGELDAAAGNLMRLAARMTGHVAADAVKTCMDDGPPDADVEYARYLSVRDSISSLASQAHDTGELLVETHRVKKDEWCCECFRMAQPREALCSGPDSRMCRDSHRCLHCTPSVIRRWDCASCGTPGDVE